MTDSTLDSAKTPMPKMPVPVLLPLPLDQPYSYAVPLGDEPPPPGSFVTVPLGQRRVTGVVWDEDGDGARLAPARLKPLIGVLAIPALPLAMRRFIDWMAAYVLAPRGAVLRMAIHMAASAESAQGGSSLGGPLAAEQLWRWSAPADFILKSPGQRRVAALLADGSPRERAEILRLAEVSAAVLRTLAARAALTPAAPAAPSVLPAGVRPPLSDAQQAAAARLCAMVAQKGFSVTLLDGVTGSGKTEVYFEAIASALAQGSRVLILLPEIALSAQWLARFSARFGMAPVLWHSELSTAKRRANWHKVATGQAPVVVGARSALFLPLDRLGLIIVDEEHDASFKQETGVVYQARDMAVVRARLADAPLALVSATPSLETLQNVARGRYLRVVLPDRYGGARLPSVACVDMRKSPPARGRWLSPPLLAAITERLSRGEQSLLFLNRRGYAPLTLCRACGQRITCAQCSAWMVEHRSIQRLICHHCGVSRPILRHCAACGAQDSMMVCGPGVERLAEEAALHFPDARCAVITSDLDGGPKAIAALIARVIARDVDILIGTQIIAKGHHFPALTLVGVVDADLGLGGSDFRSGERIFQLLSQVGGRAGRAANPSQAGRAANPSQAGRAANPSQNPGQNPGQVLLQTTDPDHAAMRALVRGERDPFNQLELEERAAHGLPPFGRLAALIVSGPTQAQAEAYARALARTAPQKPGITILGPAPAPLAVLRGRHRQRLLVKAPRAIAIQPLIRNWLATHPPTGGVRVTIDIDPYSFL